MRRAGVPVTVFVLLLSPNWDLSKHERPRPETLCKHTDRHACVRQPCCVPQVTPFLVSSHSNLRAQTIFEDVVDKARWVVVVWSDVER